MLAGAGRGGMPREGPAGGCRRRGCQAPLSHIHQRVWGKTKQNHVIASRVFDVVASGGCEAASCLAAGCSSRAFCGVRTRGVDKACECDMAGYLVKRLGLRFEPPALVCDYLVPELGTRPCCV